jgi:hypothetical protein
MTTISIVPVTKELTTLQILGINVSLNLDAVVSVCVTNEGSLKEYYTLLMDTETYSQWGDDDTFVISWTLEQLGLQPA